MNELLWLLITAACAVIGGTILWKTGFPAGAMVGGLIAVAILNIFTGNAFMPAFLKSVSKIVIGMFVGMSMTKAMVASLKHIWKPAILLVVLIQTLCFGMGVVLYYTADLDVATSLFCVAPGGMMDMTLLAMDMGGNVTVVAVIQMLRLLTVYCISMPLVKLLSRRFAKNTEEKEHTAEHKEELSKPERRKRILLTLGVGVAGGLVGMVFGELIDLSVLIMLGSMIACAAVNIKTGKLYMPRKVRTYVQMLSGGLIGLSVDAESIQALGQVIVPTILVCTGFVIINIILAIVLNRTCNMNIATGMLSSAAGGASEAALMAADFGADPATVSALQITRLACTTAFYPILVETLHTFL